MDVDCGCTFFDIKVGCVFEITPTTKKESR